MMLAAEHATVATIANVLGLIPIAYNPVDVCNLLAAAIVGFVLGIFSTFFIDWLRRPRVVRLDFRRHKANFGMLYSFQFRLKGSLDPGLCSLRIEWPGGSVFGKWDENPNPLEGDCLDRFKPELVPATFFLPLILNREYSIPILVVGGDNRCAIFSGWWFGREFGYGDPALENPDVTQITLTLSGGGGLNYSRTFSGAEILAART